MKAIKIIVIISIILILCLGAFLVINLSKEKKEPILENQDNKVIDEQKEVDEKITLKLLNEEKNIETTNILIEIQKDLENFEVIMPDNTISTEQVTEYRISENGFYKFILKLEDGTEIEKEIEVKNIKEKTEEEKEPTYIPEGFSHKEGTLKNGYVITDQYGNEFVWIPVESGKLNRKNSKKSQYEESDSSAKALVNSVARYYGFYIARYESSKADFDGTIVPTSSYNINPWNNINFIEAKEYSQNFCTIFGYNDVKSTLMNSYAWDTALNWLNNSKKSYSSSLDYGNYSEEIKQCGKTEKDCVNNIYDMAGNLKEWTTEISKIESTEDEKNEENPLLIRVLRGGSCNQKKSAQSQIGYSEDTQDEYWGFRMIIYK